MKRYVTRLALLSVCCWGWFCWGPAVWAQNALPFQQKVEVYCDEEATVKVFRLRLEQPFLAEEFEKSNFLRLQSDSNQAYLIYPKETKFEQKHAEFYGRLRGEGKASLRLSYEVVSENPDGSRRVEVREGRIEVDVPQAKTGGGSTYLRWANQQNFYFAELLRYYPDESFFQYCLLQSSARYGVTPPAIPKEMPKREALESSLYRVFTGSLAIQESLQRQALSTNRRAGDLTQHISSVAPPEMRSLPFAKLLEEKRTQDKIEPKVHAVARLVPEDQYLLHFHAIQPLSELIDLTTQWGDSLLRLYTVRAQDPRVRAKLENQLCVRWDALGELFAQSVLGEIALTGADPYLLEGSDITMILRVDKGDVFDTASQEWLEETRAGHPELVSQEFNYRGHKVVAHYTSDRAVSAFVVAHEKYCVFSNSHRAIRKIIDVAVELSPSLQQALDYRYVSTILPPSDAANSGYLYISEAFIKRLVAPAAKISQKRRLECFNNLVMLNNASLFYRLEHGRSPESLSELVQGKFVDPGKTVCPHGGGYAFDADHDMCTCSLHNRLRYLTPNAELTVLKVSAEEAAEYGRYKKRYESFWKTVFDPLAVRITVDSRLKLETCILPFANGGLYRDLRSQMDRLPQPMATERIAPSAVNSVVIVPGRERIAAQVSRIPGVAEVLQADPTLTDLTWLGDCLAIHFCDGETILQIDPTQFDKAPVPMLSQIPFSLQVAAAASVMAANVPVYLTLDVEHREQATRLLEQLSQQVFLNRSSVWPGLDVHLDAYRLPDYKEHAIYMFTTKLYVLNLRLHVALVGDQLVVATKPEILREVIDASFVEAGAPRATAHMMWRFNRGAVQRLYDDVQLYWAEKARTACHRNTISIYNLCRLYDIPVDQVGQLSEAKYGVRYYCPDQGTYAFEQERDQVVCSVHGNRQRSRQNPHLDRKSSFAQFIASLDEIVAFLRFQDDALIATMEITRSDVESE